MRPRDAALHQRPEAFDGLRVNIPAPRRRLLVVDGVVVEAALPSSRRARLVCVDIAWNRLSMRTVDARLRVGTTWGISLPS